MGETTEVRVSTYKPIGTFVGVTHGNSLKIGAEGADSTFHYIALVPNMSTIDIGGTTATQFSLRKPIRRFVGNTHDGSPRTGAKG